MRGEKQLGNEILAGLAGSRAFPARYDYDPRSGRVDWVLQTSDFRVQYHGHE